MRFLSLIVTFLFCISAQAVVVSDLYEVKLAVANQSDDELQQAAKDGLQQVFIKVSGSIETLENELLLRAADNAMRFVKSYRYSHQDDQLLVRIQFSEKPVDTQIRQAGMPIWGHSRPLLLIWQAAEIDQQRQIINAEQPQMYQLFEQAMNQRGIPILWPNLDLEDQIALPINHLWGLFRNDIEQAASRYLTDAFMAGKLSQAIDGSWHYQGFLQLKNDHLDIQLNHTDINLLVHQVADRIASFLAEHYAVADTLNAIGEQVTISGIKNFKQYQQLLEYLNANVAIKKVTVIAVNQDQLTLALDLSTDWQRVWQNLSFDKRLQETDESLVYHWQY